MNQLKFRFHVFIIIIILMSIIYFPAINAENKTNGNDIINFTSTSTTPSATPFITIDPIGNHTVGDVFFINGTTNLPASNNSLAIQIAPANLNPAGWGPSYSSTVSVIKGENGVNIWSGNVTVGPGWSVYPPEPNQSISESISESVGISNDEVEVFVSSSDVFATQTFSLFPEEQNIPQSRLPPVASFGFITSKAPGVIPLTVRFADTSTNSPTAWLWSFGDGNVSTSQNPSHTYTSAGSYTVTLKVSNAAGSNTTIMKSGIIITASSVSATTTTVSPDQTPATTQSSPLSLLVSIAALVGVVIVNSCLKKKRGS